MKKLAFVLLILITQNSYALTLTDANVFSEADSGEMTKCSLSSSNSVAAVESVLRQNRINITPDARVSFYLNNTAISLSNTCASFVSLKVNFIGIAYFPPAVGFSSPSPKRKIYTEGVLCSSGSILAGPPYNLQSRINEEFRSFAESCISEVEKIQFEK